MVWTVFLSCRGCLTSNCLCFVLFSMLSNLRDHTEVGVFGGRKPCGHPRQHTEGFEGDPVNSIRPQIIKMNTLRFAGKVKVKSTCPPQIVIFLQSFWPFPFFWTRVNTDLQTPICVQISFLYFLKDPKRKPWNSSWLAAGWLAGFKGFLGFLHIFVNFLMVFWRAQVFLQLGIH